MVTIGLHWWRRNTVISIFVGTALYMVLVNLVA
ncbi:AzlD domain-containing protein [Lactobacillus iners]